jgi:hypothetical protein
MKAKACLCVMSIMLMPLFARACDVQPAASAFFFDNDTNRDGAVDTAEWRLAQIPVAGLYMPRFNIGSMAAFKRFDLDRNGMLTEEELPAAAVDYIEDPCGEWLKFINQTK